MEMERGFDNISHDAVTMTARKLGAFVAICRWIGALINSQVISATLLHKTLEFSTLKGCLQEVSCLPFSGTLVGNVVISITNKCTHMVMMMT